MMDDLIVTWEIQQSIRALPVGFEKYFDFLSRQVQTVVLKKKLGVEFYVELINNLDSTDEKWTNLIDGCTFSYGNYNYESKGLKVFLAHLIAAEFQVRGKFFETTSGLTIKTNQDFEGASLSAQKQMRAELSEFAYTFWTEIDRYLLANYQDYPLYMISARPNSVYKPQIDKI